MFASYLITVMVEKRKGIVLKVVFGWLWLSGSSVVVVVVVKDLFDVLRNYVFNYIIGLMGYCSFEREIISPSGSWLLVCSLRVIVDLI